VIAAGGGIGRTATGTEQEYVAANMALDYHPDLGGANPAFFGSVQMRVIQNDTRPLFRPEQVEAPTNLPATTSLKKLTGTANAYRIRVGECGVEVTIQGDNVEFVRFLPRRDLYRYVP